MRENTSDQKTQKNKSWNWHPDFPLQLSPILSWPPRPLATLKWLAGYWLVISSVTIEFLFACAVFTLFQPEASVMAKLAPGWIFQIWVRNMILITLIAGGLHLWLYRNQLQGNKRKFDHRGQAKNNGKFLFRDQVRDNMFWSLASGVTIWTVLEVGYFWAAANGYMPGLEWRQNPIWFAAFFVIIPIWSSFHFYLIHRLSHWQPLYKLAHGLHHRNINVGPWSGISMHPVEHLLYFSSVMIHVVVPSHPLHVLFHFYQEALNPPFTHSGFEQVMLGDNPKIAAGDFFHQLHHRHINCNYGTREMPWDRVFNSYHDGNGIVKNK